MLTKILIGAVLATVAMSGTAGAQQLPAVTQQTATIKRTSLQKFDVPGTNYETVIGIAEIVPNVNVGRHTHPGPESGYMIEGEMVLLVEAREKAREMFRRFPKAAYMTEIESWRELPGDRIEFTMRRLPSAD